MSSSYIPKSKYYVDKVINISRKAIKKICTRHAIKSIFTLLSENCFFFSTEANSLKHCNGTWLLIEAMSLMKICQYNLSHFKQCLVTQPLSKSKPRGESERRGKERGDSTAKINRHWPLLLPQTGRELDLNNKHVVSAKWICQPLSKGSVNLSE